MRMPDDLFALVQAFAAAYPPPHGFAGETHDELCRRWTQALAEQAVFTFPQGGYGCKRAGEDRPLSKDTLARFGDDFLGGDVLIDFIGWDVLIGAGTGAPAVIGAPTESLDLYGQVFVPVAPRDWLAEAAASASPSPSPSSAPPASPSPSSDDCCCCEVLQVLKAELAAANEQRQVLIELTSKILSRLQATPTMEQLTMTPVLVKLRW